MKHVPHILFWLAMSIPAKFIFLVILLLTFLLSVPAISEHAKQNIEKAKQKLPDITEFCKVIKETDDETYGKYCTK